MWPEVWWWVKFVISPSTATARGSALSIARRKSRVSSDTV
jgi:hypothetical protein